MIEAAIPVLFYSYCFALQALAIEQARKGASEGGIPIGAVLVVDGKVVAKGHNQVLNIGE